MGAGGFRESFFKQPLLCNISVAKRPPSWDVTGLQNGHYRHK